MLRSKAFFPTDFDGWKQCEMESRRILKLTGGWLFDVASDHGQTS
jgi:hypothetical protein